MTTLLSRLQSAPGPSRELDAEIALANGWRHLPSDLWVHLGQAREEPPRYTEIDNDARTLLPEGMLWSVSCVLNGYRAVVWIDTIYVGHSDATPAIALLIAIMHAREDSKP